MTIHVRIERLVLDGLDLAPHEQRTMAEALRAELAVRLGGRAVEGREALAATSAATVSASADPTELGTDVGRTVAGVVGLT
jgi:hypothetical protein